MGTKANLKDSMFEEVGGRGPGGEIVVGLLGGSPEDVVGWHVSVGESKLL